MLSESQLLAVHAVLDERIAEKKREGAAAAAGSSSSPVVAAPRAAPPLINMAHVRRALEAARSSLPAGERRRLEAIYARFRKAREPASVGGGEQAVIPHGDGSSLKRSTLA